MLVIQSQYSPARWAKPDAYHISFTNGTAVQPLTDGVILGGSMQVHSREAGHRYYTVLFEEQGTVEEHCRLSGVSGGGIKAPWCRACNRSPSKTCFCNTAPACTALLN